MGTNLDKGIGFAKPDSMGIVIPETAIRYNGSGLLKNILHIDADTSEVYGETKEAPSFTFSIDGMPYKAVVRKPLPNEDFQNDVRLIELAFNAKMLGVERYHEGVSIDNFEEITRKIETASGLRLERYAWSEARFQDLDCAVDRLMTAEEWNEYLRSVWQSIPIELQKSHCHLFQGNDGLAKGITFNKRKKVAHSVTLTRSFVKLYSKEQEHLDYKREVWRQPTEWARSYDPGLTKRLEATVRNGFYSQDERLKQLGKPRSLSNVLMTFNDQNQTWVEYANAALQRYASQRILDLKVRDMSQEKPTDWIFRELVQIQQEQDALPLKERATAQEMIFILKARADVFDKVKAYKIRKLIDEHADYMFPKIPNQGDIRF